MKRLPPHNKQAEESILGAMLLSPTAAAVGVELLDRSDFYSPSNGEIFSAIESLYSSNGSIDAVTVAEELRRTGTIEKVGGTQAIVALMAAAPSTQNADKYAKIVLDHSKLRQLQSLTFEAQHEIDGIPNDVERFVLEFEEKVFKINDSKVADPVYTIGEIVYESLDNLAMMFQSDSKITGLPTGFDDLDELMSGLQSSSLTILGARPSMGKTALALNIASHVSIRLSKPVLFFSLEMGENELMQRILASEAHIDSTRLKNGNLYESDWDRLLEVYPKIESAPLVVDDNPSIDIQKIRARCRRSKMQYGELGLIVVDYLQLMTNQSSENRQLEISEISRGLKVLSRELETPILALSQLSRGVEGRMDKRPMLSDLRESGSLEQDADNVIFIYRDEVYNSESDDKGIAEVLLPKHRSGPTGVVRLAHLPPWVKFVNIERTD